MKRARDPNGEDLDDDADNVEDQQIAKQARGDDSNNEGDDNDSYWDNYLEDVEDDQKVMSAAQSGDIQCLQELVGKGYDLTTIFFGENDNSILHEACDYNCDLDFIKLLVNNGVDIHTKDENERTPLHKACWHQNSEVAKWLVQKGADVTAVDRDGSTALHRACSNNDLDVIKSLIANGASVHHKDKYGYTPLLRADENADGYGEVVKLLVENGADPNAKGYAGKSMLHSAYIKPEGSKALIENGTDLNAQDNEGETPLHSACWYGDVQLVRLFLSRGANVDAKALDVACAENHPEVVWSLVREYPWLVLSEQSE